MVSSRAGHEGSGAAGGPVGAVVLGAGIAGLVSTSILLEQGAGRVLVLDEYPRVGGNHIDRAHGGFTFDVGSFIFQDDSPLLAHFPELLPRYVPIRPSWGKLNPQGAVTRYPFSLRDDFLAAGPLECARMLASAAGARLRRRPLRSARDFARYWIGARMLHRSGLEDYMERFCGLPAERIDLQFAEERMRWICERASLTRTLRRAWAARFRPIARQVTNTQLARPAEGFEHLYQPAVRRLTAGGAVFRLGARPSRIEKVDGGFRVHLDGASINTSRVISTIPLDHALRLCGLDTEPPLPSVTLLSLFFSFAGERGFPDAVLYNFSHDGAWKRLTVYSDFYGRVAGREYFAAEVIADRVRGSVELAERDFRAHTGQNRLFRGDLRLEGSHLLAQAYPIFTGGAGERARRAIATLRGFGIESFGRQGGFRYQPTARVSTQEAEAALRR